MWNKIILKWFWNHFSVLFHIPCLKPKENYFSCWKISETVSHYFSYSEHVGKYSRAAISFWNNFQIISGKFPRAKSLNDFEILSTAIIQTICACTSVKSNQVTTCKVWIVLTYSHFLLIWLSILTITLLSNCWQFLVITFLCWLQHVH